MEEYVNQQRELYNQLLNYIDEDEDDENYFQLMEIINNLKLIEDQDDLQELLLIIDNISNNHHRYPNFFDKIERIINNFTGHIKKNFSKTEIFNIFSGNKRILLYFIENKILTIDESIMNLLNSKFNYSQFFYPEVKKFLNEANKKLSPSILENFEEKRKIGENESYLCHLIRNDSIEDFVTYVTKNNTSLTARINISIFETNAFLLDKTPSLIEYAGFFGSIQIIKYLLFNKVKLESSMWSYIIHSNNAELFHILEEFNISPCDGLYEQYIEESIKCHHNDITSYLLDYFLKATFQSYKFGDVTGVIKYCFMNHNYQFFPSNFDNNLIFCYMCIFNYIKLVRFLLDSKSIDINQKMIFIIIIFK